MSESLRNRTVLGADSHFEGKLAVENDAVLLGRFKGTLRVAGQLDIGPTAEIEGTVIADEVRLTGRIDGALIARDRVAMSGSAAVDGKLFTPDLAIEPGVTLTGRIAVGQDARAQAQPLLEELEIADFFDRPRPQRESIETDEAAAVEPTADEAPQPMVAAHQPEPAAETQPSEAAEEADATPAEQPSPMLAQTQEEAPVAVDSAEQPTTDHPAIATVQQSLSDMLQRRPQPRVLTASTSHFSHG